MSDDEDLQYVKRKRVVHFGALDKDDLPDVTESSGDNVQISTEYMEIEKETIPSDKMKMLEEFERRRRVRAITVSTNDGEVKADLRSLGEPICLFGEGPADRRTRLRELLGKLGIDSLAKRKQQGEAKEEKKRDDDTTWYHEGPDTLRIAREWLVNYSIPKATERIQRLKKQSELSENLKMAKKQEVQKKMKCLDVEASQIVDTRPVSWCQFSPDNKMLVTGSWSGLCKLWSVPDCKEIRPLRGHTTHVGSIVFNPRATLGLDPGEINLASCAADGSVKLWSLDSDEPLADIEGHDARVSRCAYHPSGRFLGTAVWDNSWRLWDLEQLTEVLHQEGHSKEVYCLAFQSDGSLVCSGGLDSFGRVWDLRTGQCIMFLEGHLKGITGVDWSPDGYHIVTCSQDNSCKIWDLRKRNIEYTIPAHTKLVSNVRFEKNSGEYLVSSSYDGTAKVWATKTWLPLATLKGHDNKVSACDISPDGSIIATSSFDRTFKIWTFQT
eukprot:TRINITY_DN1198_c0_g1_i1.p1 TRINITY_DN1198_c0_g1~~TRINITY_DN1198_c0_g1_i1.p1  ORF type:complete len:496 (-),score=101.29 TRINITY_DN1198_c0_g1_i1:97-1584(-)